MDLWSATHRPALKLPFYLLRNLFHGFVYHFFLTSSFCIFLLFCLSCISCLYKPVTPTLQVLSYSFMASTNHTWQSTLLPKTVKVRRLDASVLWLRVLTRWPSPNASICFPCVSMQRLRGNAGAGDVWRNRVTPCNSRWGLVSVQSECGPAALCYATTHSQTHWQFYCRHPIIRYIMTFMNEFIQKTMTNYNYKYSYFI